MEGHRNPRNFPNSGESEREAEVGTEDASLAQQWNSACAEAENEVALGCNAKSSIDTSNVQFTELPDLVVEEIMKHLDASSKLSLREVCHATKKWIDYSKFICTFRVSVNSNAEMTNLINSHKTISVAKWGKFKFPENDFTKYDLFYTFLCDFSSYITTLEMHNFNASITQILFLSICVNLRQLKIDEMDLREDPALVIASDKSLKAKCPKLLDVFTELRELSIGTIFFNDVNHLPFYQTFLQRCRKLEKLNVPRTQGPSSIIWEALKDIQLKYVITPLKEYLQKKPITSPIKTDIKLLDVGGLFSRHFPVLAEACIQIGSPTLFDNVNEKHVKYLFNHEEDILQRIVSLREKVDDRRPIWKWENLQILYVRSSRCDIRREYPELIAYPKLRHLTLVMDTKSKDDPNFYMLQRLRDLLIFRPRENLEIFILQWPLFSHDTPRDYIRASHFVGNFLNLTKLHISGWTVPDDDFLLIFEFLCKLKELILEECVNLTDWGVIGHTEMPAIMNLKDLTKLEIRNRINSGLLTDTCFERAFMHMRLKYFLIDSFYATVKGYDFLSKGEFSSTIRRFPVPNKLPRGILTVEEFTLLVTSRFPNVIF